MRLRARASASGAENRGKPADLTRLVVPGLLNWPTYTTLDKMGILRRHLLAKLVGLFNSDGEKPTLAI